MKYKQSLIPVLCALVASNAIASPVHTWHDIEAKQSKWYGRLTLTSSNQQAFFTDAKENNKGSTYDFSLEHSTSPLRYGFGFTHADFNVSYVLTMYEYSSDNSQFSAKACQFDVSASNPATPDIRIEQYNGAECNYSIVPHQGENFIVG